MRLVAYRRSDRTGIGLLEAGMIIDILALVRGWPSQAGALASVPRQVLSADLQGLLAAGPQMLSDLQALVNSMDATDDLLDPDVAFRLENAALLPPVLRPGKVICAGLNYPPLSPSSFDPPAFPVLFHKTATSLVGHADAVYMPPEVDQLEYEGELAVVIGQGGRRIPRGQAWQHVAGLTAANDVGAPQIQGRSSQWTSGKMLDTFCPLGPVLVTCDEFPDPDNLRLRTWLNDELVQDAYTGEMRFDIPALVSYISGLATLEPGDLILTGSPKRVGDQPDPRLPVRPGDRMSVEIEGIGRLENPVMKEVLSDGC